MLSDDQLKELLTQSRTIAVYGMSRNPAKAAYQVPAVLKRHGFRVIPVNPFADEIMGERSYDSLAAIPDEIDIVDVFRPSAEALGVVKGALARHEERGDVRLIWLQLGIRNAEAARLAAAAGVPFVQNLCMAVEVPRLLR
jgi:hypothetical protein